MAFDEMKDLAKRRLGQIAEEERVEKEKKFDPKKLVEEEKDAGEQLKTARMGVGYGVNQKINGAVAPSGPEIGDVSPEVKKAQDLATDEQMKARSLFERGAITKPTLDRMIKASEDQMGKDVAKGYFPEVKTQGDEDKKYDAEDNALNAKFMHYYQNGTAVQKKAAVKNLVLRGLLSSEELSDEDRSRYVDGDGFAATAEEAKDLRKHKASFTTVTGALEKMKQLQEADPAVIADPANIRRYDALKSMVMLNIKNLEKTGALDQGTLDVLGPMLGDLSKTNLVSNLTGGGVGGFGSHKPEIAAIDTTMKTIGSGYYNTRINMLSHPSQQLFNQMQQGDDGDFYARLKKAQ